MSDTLNLPDRITIKTHAKRLRQSLVAEGNFVSHSEALELVSKQYGFRDWNTMSAALETPAKRPLQVGHRVTGRYLGHAFTGTLLGLQNLAGGRRQVALQLDKPIDVVKSRWFTSFRQRITGTLETSGETYARTSDGEPVLALHC